MRLWLLLIASFVVQELVSANFFMLQAHQLHYNLWLVHAVFVAATIFDLWFGFEVGKWTQQHFAGSWLVARARLWSGGIENFLGPSGERLSVLLLGFVSYPHLNGFLASWLSMRFRHSFIFLLAGDLLWYLADWLLIMGVRALVPNPYGALYTLLAVCVIATIALRLVSRKLLKRQ